LGPTQGKPRGQPRHWLTMPIWKGVRRMTADVDKVRSKRPTKTVQINRGRKKLSSWRLESLDANGARYESAKKKIIHRTCTETDYIHQLWDSRELKRPGLTGKKARFY